MNNKTYLYRSKGWEDCCYEGNWVWADTPDCLADISDPPLSRSAQVLGVSVARKSNCSWDEEGSDCGSHEGWFHSSAVISVEGSCDPFLGQSGNRVSQGLLGKIPPDEASGSALLLAAFVQLLRKWHLELWQPCWDQERRVLIYWGMSSGIREDLTPWCPHQALEECGEKIRVC